MKDYVKRIHDLRTDRHLTLQQVADFLTISPDIYARFECENGDLPTAQLIRLSALYGVSVDYLLCITDKPERLT